MSNRKFPEYEDDPTMVAPGIVGQHPANTNPFESQSHGVVASTDLSSEATMVVEGPDLSSEATMVHDSLANPLAPIAKLLVLEGVQQGKEYPLLGTEISFGREKDNTISHPDLSVSRRHFKVHYKGDKFILEDLGSSSGTLLNNKRVSGTSKLQHGDKIQVGKTLLEFQLLGEAAQNASSRGGISPLVIGLVVGVLALGGIGVGIFIVKDDKVPPDASEHSQKQPKTPRQPLQQNAATFIKRGLELRGQLNWRLAKLQFQQASQLAPNSFQAKQLYAEMKGEEKADFYLRRADHKRSQGLSKEAHESLEQANKFLPTGSINAEKVWRLRVRLMPKDATPMRTRRNKNDAKWYIKQGSWQQAAAIFTKRRKRKKGALLQGFLKNFRAGQAAYRRWQPKEAIDALLKANQQDLKLSGSSSVFSTQIKDMLANMYCARGVAALAKKKPDYQLAYRSFQKGTIYVPTHKGLQAQLANLRALAKKWLGIAKKIKGSNKAKAINILKSIKLITSRSDEVNKEARALLK